MPNRRNLLLLTVDTWRGDHFMTTMGGVDLTPNLSRLAAKSIVFRHAYSAANVTVPGVAAILTGVLPWRAGVVLNSHLLQASVPTIASLLAARGYDTAAFVANPILRPGSGFEAGFDTYELAPSRLHKRKKARADQVNRLALEWLGRRAAERPFFLWLHYMEPHGPYEPPQEMVERFDIDAFEADREIPILPAGVQAGNGGIPYYQLYGQASFSRDGRDYLLRYAGEVADLDRQLGLFLEDLDAAGWLNETVLALTSDHGEALAGDHGFFFSHGNGLTQDQISVPFLLRIPGEEAAVVDEAVSTLDVLPTLLELLDVSPPPHLDGENLLAASGRPNRAVAQAKGEATLVLWPWKVTIHRGEQHRSEMHDLLDDPGESRDISGEQSGRYRELRGHLVSALRKPVLAEPRERSQANGERLEELRALGYL